MLSLVTVKVSPSRSCWSLSFDGAGWIFEVSCDRFFYRLAGVQQPQHNEQCHHGGDKICIGDFPCAAMVAGMAALSFL